MFEILMWATIIVFGSCWISLLAQLWNQAKPQFSLEPCWYRTWTCEKYASCPPGISIQSCHLITFCGICITWMSYPLGYEAYEQSHLGNWRLAQDIYAASTSANPGCCSSCDKITNVSFVQLPYKEGDFDWAWLCIPCYRYEVSLHKDDFIRML